jgi:tetratricopeptide (TPR) repeat protein
MLRLRLLGDLTIELDAHTIEPPTSRRARALLGWLALDRRMHTRSSLAPRFWPDVLDESARTSLRSALSALRKSLGPGSERYLVAGRDDVGLADEELVWTDVGEFERCVAQGRLQEALEVCRGELLAGLDDDWSRGAYEDALSAGRRAVELGNALGWGGWVAPTLGWALLDLLDAESAAEILERGLAAAQRIGRPNETVRCLSQLAWARWLLGDGVQASVLAARAEKLLEQVSAPPGGAFLFGSHAYVALARVHLSTGRPERGEALLRPLLGAAKRSGWLEAQATTELVLGLCLEARGELEQAREALADAAEVSDRYGIPAPSWEAHAALARILGAVGSSAEANDQAAAAGAIVARISRELKDGAMTRRLRERTNL